MKPPYTITPNILKLVAAISEQLGAINSIYLEKPDTHLRKENRIKTIHSSLEIEGNTLSLEQVSAVFDGKRVLGPAKEVLEVQNAIKAYELLLDYQASSLDSFCNAHALLMQGLVDRPGVLRSSSVGIVAGAQVRHIAPAGHMVHGLMNDLFSYLQNDDDLLLIKSCVFHYELEFIHPFTDGNGRMGRLWQTVILLQQYPVFAYLPMEVMIKEHQQAYYQALSNSDKSGQSTPFIDFMLKIIQSALKERLSQSVKPLSAKERLAVFKEYIQATDFNRSNYLQHFKTISSATASRDLKLGVEHGILQKTGIQNNTRYRFH